MRLLFAEDEKSLSRAITAILKKNHYEVDAVYDGEEALAYLECGTYDGAILDIMMPKIDGLSVLKEIRRQGNNIPVLMLTAKAIMEVVLPEPKNPLVTIYFVVIIYSS